MVAILVMIGLKLMQRHTLIGRAMQAVAHDKRAAALMGINVNRIVAFSFGLALLLGAAAGVGFGIVEKLVEGYISTAAREIIGFGVMILVLLAFRQGLFGKREVFKV